MTFTRIQDSTAADWEAIGRAQAARHEREYRWVLKLLEALGEITDGFQVDQLTHSLVLATKLQRANFPSEIVLVGLLHDIGKPLSLVNHPAVAAAMLREYLSDHAYQILARHGEYLADITHDTAEAERYLGEPWHADCRLFAVLDAESFDPDYPAEPLSHFEPGLRRLYRLEP